MQVVCLIFYHHTEIVLFQLFYLGQPHKNLVENQTLSKDISHQVTDV